MKVILVLIFYLGGVLASQNAIAQQYKNDDAQWPEIPPLNIKGFFGLSHADSMIRVNERIRLKHAVWSHGIFTPFETYGTRLEKLKLREQDIAGPVEVSDTMRAELQTAVRYFILALRAKTFNEFKSAISRGGSDLPRPEPAAILYWRTQLASNKLLTQEEAAKLSDDDILEINWASETSIGAGAQYYTALCEEKSSCGFLLLTRSNDVRKTLVDALPERPRNIGMRVKARTCFNYGAPLDLTFKQQGGRVLTAFVTLHVMTSSGNGYPILIRYMWVEQRKNWQPIDWAELWAAKRVMTPIY